MDLPVNSTNCAESVNFREVAKMCRLVGIVTSEPTEFRLALREAPRSLSKLSREHPDGWGVAIHDAAKAGARWRLHRGTERADADASFHEVAAQSRGHVLVAHVRQKTVGPTRLENTHPFERDGWVFAHNGTVHATDYLRKHASASRLDEVTGDTDSELLFAFVLTRLDERGLTRLADEDGRRAATLLLLETARELRARQVGAFNFLLSDGATSFAHRFGRSLFVLERGPGDPVRASREVSPGAEILTKWTARRRAVFIASERLTDEPWREVPDCTLLRIDREPEPAILESVTEGPGRAA
jgi:predicted glutamine amidotransferase